MAEHPHGHDAHDVRTHAVVFDDPEVAIEAVRAMKREGYEVGDVFCPFPVPGMAEAVGLPPSRLGFATLVGGITGLSAGLALQLYVHAYAWPLIIGGKDNVAPPLLVPVCFELTILLAAFATVSGLFGKSRLWPGRKGRVPAKWQRLATDDRFVVVVVERDGSFARAEFAALCKQLRAENVFEGGRVEG